MTADTAEKAQRLAAAAALWRARKDLNYDSPIPSLEHAERDKEWSDEERARAVTRENGFIHGTPEHVRDQLLALAEQHRASEIMVNTLTSDPADRDASYTLLADAFDQAAVGVA